MDVTETQILKNVEAIAVTKIENLTTSIKYCEHMIKTRRERLNKDQEFREVIQRRINYKTGYMLI